MEVGGLIRRKEIRRQKFKLEKDQENHEQKTQNANERKNAYERQNANAQKEDALLDSYAEFS